MKQSRAEKEYLSLVSAQLPWRGKRSRSFLSFLSADVLGFCAEYPSATVEELCEQFGQPDQLALSFADSFGSENMRSSASLTAASAKVLLAALLFAALFYLIMYAVNLISTLPSAQDSIPTYYLETIDLTVSSGDAEAADSGIQQTTR